MSRADRLLKSLQSRKKVGTKVHYKEAQNCEACADKFNDLYVTDTHVEICKKCWQYNVDMGDLPPLKEGLEEGGTDAIFWDSEPIKIGGKPVATFGILKGATGPQNGLVINGKLVLAMNWDECRAFAKVINRITDLAEFG